MFISSNTDPTPTAAAESSPLNDPTLVLLASRERAAVIIGEEAPNPSIYIVDDTDLCFICGIGVVGLDKGPFLAPQPPIAALGGDKGCW